MMKMFLPLMMAGLMSMLFLGHKSKWGMILLIEVLLISLIFSLPINEVVEVVTSWVALDIMSAGLVMLSVYLVLLMYLSSTSIFNTNNHVELYCLTSILLLLSLIFCFAVSSYLLFYLFFELSLIPTFFIIMGWGYQPERLQAGVYLILYTLLASLPLLFILMKMNTVMGSLWMWDYLMGQWCLNSGYWFSLMVTLGAMFAFLVKLPMFVTHLWLPKAHLEAPVAGSMILAGVLLKLGGYGLMRVLVKLYSGYLQMSVIFFSLSLVGMVVVGVMCCRLNDLKALVAYSSVAHMGLVICGSLTGTSWGFNGSLMMMISHGLVSSGLFCMVNVMYERLHSRSMHLNSGVLSLMPIFSLLMFLLCCSNISAPPTINLLSEISLLTSIFSFDGVGMLVFPLGSFFGAVFTFYMFSLSQHGKFYRVVQSLNLGMLAEMHVLVLHVLAINLLILKNDLFFSMI